MSAWVELITREEARRDADLVRMHRIAALADKKSYDEFRKKHNEVGS